MLFFIPVLRRQTPFTRFLTRAWIVASVGLLLWLGGTLVAEDRNLARHGVRATLVLDGPAHAKYVDATGYALPAPGWLLDDRTVRDLQDGQPVAVEFLRQDPWGTVRRVGQHHHGGVVLIVAAVLAGLGMRYWKRI